MNCKASGRTFIAVAALAFVAAIAHPASACSPAQCPSNNADQQGLSANALPTYPEPAAEPAAQPMKLKLFTRRARHTAKQSHARKVQLAQRARAGRLAAARKTRQEDVGAKVTAARKVAPVFANANAQFADATATSKASAYASPFDTVAQAEVTEPAPPTSTETQASTGDAPVVELVSANEFNDLDRAAWEANQMPKLMQLKASDSRAELRDDDSRWAQTSTIGKIFVAFGALLTLGSAVRMFMA